MDHKDKKIPLDSSASGFYPETNPEILPHAGVAGQPLFSLIISCYQAEKYVRTCLASICCQNEENFEIICVDDDSQDDTERLIRSFAALDQRIRYIRHDKNQGQFFARRTGLLNAKGTYCWFIDVDDYIAPDALSCLRKIVTEHPDTDIVQFRCLAADCLQRREHETKIHFPVVGVFSGSQIKEWIFSSRKPLVSIWLSIFCRRFLLGDAWKIQDLPAKRRSEDLLYTMFPLYAKKIVSIDRFLYKYRTNFNGHDSELSNSKLLIGLMQNNVLLLKTLKTLELSDDEKNSFCRFFASFFMERASSFLTYLPFFESISYVREIKFIAQNIGNPPLLCGPWKLFETIMKELPVCIGTAFLCFWIPVLKLKNRK